MKKLLLSLALLSTTVTAFAGGWTPEIKFQEGVVSCFGANGEILIRVFKDQYNGEFLTLKDAKVGATIKLTNKQIISAAKKLELISERKLFNLPENEDHLALFLNVDPSIDTQTVASLGGATNELLYMSLPLMIKSLTAPGKSEAPKITNYLNVSVQQKSETNYLVSFNKIQAGQRTCVREIEISNPYFMPGSSMKPTFMSCAEWVDVSEQKIVAKITTELVIDKCVLK